jgi:hypothetical protein
MATAVDKDGDEPDAPITLKVEFASLPQRESEKIRKKLRQLEGGYTIARPRADGNLLMIWCRKNQEDEARRHMTEAATRYGLNVTGITRVN